MLANPLLSIVRGFKKSKEPVIYNIYIYKNKLDNASFPHDAAYSGSKELAERTATDKILQNRAYEIASNL